MRYKAIIVEDKDNDWIDFLSDLLKKLNFKLSNIFVAYTQTEALKIISGNEISFAFVDITLPIKSAQSPEVINAGLEIIRQIAENDIKQNRNSLIFLFSNNINDPEVDGYKEIIQQYTDHKIIQLPKFNLQSQKAKPRLVETIFKAIWDWQLARITQMKDPSQWRNLLAAISKKKYSETIIFDGNTIQFSDFLFVDISFNNTLYFKCEDIEIELKKMLAYPKKGKWGNENSWGVLTEIYFKFLELDKEKEFIKLHEIETKSEDYVINLVNILLGNPFPNKAKLTNLSYSQSAKVPSLNSIRSIFDIEIWYYNTLIIRNVVLAICKISDLLGKNNWKYDSTIVALFDTEADLETNKQFMLAIGIRTNSKRINPTSYLEEIFYTEEAFLSRFDNQWINKELRLNNSK